MPRRGKNRSRGILARASRAQAKIILPPLTPLIVLLRNVQNYNNRGCVGEKEIFHKKTLFLKV